MRIASGSGSGSAGKFISKLGPPLRPRLLYLGDDHFLLVQQRRESAGEALLHSEDSRILNKSACHIFRRSEHFDQISGPLGTLEAAQLYRGGLVVEYVHRT